MNSERSDISRFQPVNHASKSCNLTGEAGRQGTTQILLKVYENAQGSKHSKAVVLRLRRPEPFLNTSGKGSTVGWGVVCN